MFDPFVGVGTSLVASVYWNRKSIGVDKESVYTDLAYERVKAAINGTLKRRLLGRPVYVPTENEKVAQIPSEWKKKD